MKKEAVPDLHLSAFSYDLKQEDIAQYPLAERDLSRLLIYKQGTIQHATFRELDEYIPSGALLVVNNTRVIPARLFFERKTGAKIEILLITPVVSLDYAQAMQSQGSVSWQCMVGNKKRWKAGESLYKTLFISGEEVRLRVNLEDSVPLQVTFSWEPASKTFDQILAVLGTMPLPPYLQRLVEPADTETYQTIYSQVPGAVAAPTAGLHFTPYVMRRLEEKGIDRLAVSLHVGAGTFLPVKSEHIAEHEMHVEHFEVSLEALKRLCTSRLLITAVGTTSLRVLETLYWLGLRVHQEGELEDCPVLTQDFPYLNEKSDLDANQSLGKLIEYLERKGKNSLYGKTGIFIVPGYRFKVVRGLITNFHLPESTLIMLVSAFIGEDWRKVYVEAGEQGYRFLSYGDASLLIP